MSHPRKAGRDVLEQEPLIGVPWACPGSPWNRPHRQQTVWEGKHNSTACECSQAPLESTSSRKGLSIGPLPWSWAHPNGRVNKIPLFTDKSHTMPKHICRITCNQPRENNRGFPCPQPSGNSNFRGCEGKGLILTLRKQNIQTQVARCRFQPARAMSVTEGSAGLATGWLLSPRLLL